MEYPSRISFAEARRLLDAVARSGLLPDERVPLARGLGRILGEDVIAANDLPGFDNAAMDGFAVRGSDLQPDGDSYLTLVGEQFAGPSAGHAIEAGQCVRITTGAHMPLGADTVVMKENADLVVNRLVVNSAVRPGTHVRRAGEDARAGEAILRMGQVLTPACLSLAAATGHHDLPVRRRPTVALFTTGDELKPPGMPLGAGEIYDSNRVLLQSMLQADGYEPVAWPLLPDDPVRIEAALRDAAFSFDVVITCGGVSAGEKDYLPALMQAHGEVHFWKVRMRPGMPLLAGRLGTAHLLCLPGNPVSVLATYLTLARGFLDALQGRGTPRARFFASLEAPLIKSHDRLEFLRANLRVDPMGSLSVAINPADGSHRLRAASESDALVVIPEGAGEWPAGAVFEVLPLPAL